MNEAKIKIVTDYIKEIDKSIDNYNSDINVSDEIFDLIIEISNVFEQDIPQIKASILLRTGTEIRDANTVKALLKMYLANEGVEYKEKEQEENLNVKRFWKAFILWFERELVNLELLQGQYLQWDNWNGGTWYLNMDYDHEFKLRRGVEYPDSLKKNTGEFEDIKTFLEMAYKYWIINDGKAHYAFTVEVNCCLAH